MPPKADLRGEVHASEPPDLRPDRPGSGPDPAPGQHRPQLTPDYDAPATAAGRPLPDDGQLFAGPRDEPFFADLGALFDLLTIRKLPGNAGGGVDGLAGHNVHSILLQLPAAQLAANGQPVNKGDLGNPNAVIGAWTTASRPKLRVLHPGKQTSSGDVAQVSRLGNRLVNEVVVPLAVKDAFNTLNPVQDVAAGALPLVLDAEPARLLKALYNVDVPPAPRTDLVAVFLTGIPGSILGLPGGTAPMNVPAGAETGSEMMRLNMATPPTAIGAGNRLAATAGDVTGYPNGRRLVDDVVDISGRAVAGATYPLTTPGFTPDPLAGQLGDGVDGNDKAFLASFPYLASPWQGCLGCGRGAPHSPTPTSTTTTSTRTRSRPLGGLGAPPPAAALLRAGADVSRGGRPGAADRAGRGGRGR